MNGKTVAAIAGIATTSGMLAGPTWALPIALAIAISVTMGAYAAARLTGSELLPAEQRQQNLSVAIIAAAVGAAFGATAGRAVAGW